MKILFRFITVSVIGLLVHGAAAQTIGVSCPKFFSDRHQAIACTEAVFSQDDYHFTLASLPPSNGFGPGLVLIKKIRGAVGTPAREYAVDLSVTGAVTTNSSWFAGGDLRWIPPLPYQSDDRVANGLRLGKLTTTERANLHLSATHRTVRTLYFYGNGSGSPVTQYVFAQDDTSLDAVARMPLTRWLIAIGESEVRDTTLPAINNPAAVSSNLPRHPRRGSPPSHSICITQRVFQPTSRFAPAKSSRICPSKMIRIFRVCFSSHSTTTLVITGSSRRRLSFRLSAVCL